VQDGRELYSRGLLLIAAVVMLAALGCVLLMLFVLNLLDNIILRPLTNLVGELNGINHFAGGRRVTVDNSNQEMSNLTNAINSMLAHIEEEQDIIKKKNESLYKSACMDALTGLSNRMNATDELEESIRIAKEGGYHVTAYHMDIDRFKFVNDTIGHKMGNELMKLIAARLSERFGEGDIIARMNGDEFMVCVDNLESKADARACADVIMGVFKEPFMVGGRSIEISASIGSASYPEDGKDAETLIKNAEMAMYQAKDSGKGIYIPYRKYLQEVLQHRVNVENRLRAAVNNGCNDFIMYFQPKLSVESGAIEKCEALIRWESHGSMIGPNDFIPPAEETGLIVPMTWWIIEECRRQGRFFSDNGMPMAMAVNIPAQVLVHKEFVRRITEANSGMGGSRMDIEIVERTLLEDMEVVENVFRALHDEGMEISVDDFGTGYSSLSYLNRLSVDGIKIDQSFVRDLNNNTDDQSIVRAIIAMAKSLGITVTAEGVEDIFQYDFLSNVFCDEIQGYFISRPVDAERYIQFIKDWRESGGISQ